MKKALIISDGKPGHFNQSVAFCRHLGLDYEIREMAYKSRAHKALSYLLDHLNIYTQKLFTAPIPQPAACALIISAGSTTYYANKLVARKSGLPNIGILYPHGYRLDFSHIFCPAYDHPPGRDNITELPLNLCAADESFFAEKADEFRQRHPQNKPAVGVIIGGGSAVSEIDPAQIRRQLDQLFQCSEGCERWVTTSRRTPPEVEQIVESFPFDYTLINSRETYNPVPAFIALCNRLFVTSDSASMISECASFGQADVEILMTRQRKSPNKFEELIQGLEKHGAVHIFDGTPGEAGKKINVAPLLNPVKVLLDRR